MSTQIDWQFQGSTTRADYNPTRCPSFTSIRCPKCGSTSVIYYGLDLYGCCNIQCEYKWKIPSVDGEFVVRLKL